MALMVRRYVPEEVRATVMNIFRVPLNFIVVTLLSKVSVCSSSKLVCLMDSARALRGGGGQAFFCSPFLCL